MVRLYPIQIDEQIFTAVEVHLPKTTLLSISNEVGYVMCGALDVELLRTRLAAREIVAARAVGVKTIEELLMGQVESCTQSAEALGIFPGMSIREALQRMSTVKSQA
ncbi:YunC family protein [Alicyclobacillus tolerans]|uniref:Uncharacterized protein YunC (DUF1805 family) n=1 Tax=Alicyclobacillus tolerans TaxID=90970 RepID=A0ABT9LT98_9BACL|nr:DUF1805 domain-containing protein [Alicyclobacillus tengchongensis]MDP9727497.1 uncharacterized protein YunC (DUF1805 family) [Alicyclobacillus tengchongensis]